MASNTHTGKLGQLLQEKQEPFKLKTYLLERGCSRYEADSENLGSYDATKFLKICVNKKTKMVSRFSKTLATLATKLVSINNFDTNSEQEIDTQRGKYNWSCMENKQQQQQLSPVSVLEEAYSHHNSPLHNVEKVTSNVSAEEPNTIFTPANSLPDQLIDAEISLNYSNIKLQLWRTPLDCMIEVIRAYKPKNSTQQQQDFLDVEEIQRVLHENVLKWSKQSSKDESKTATKLIDFDLSSSFEDWKFDSQEQRLSIAKVLGESILDDIVISDFVHQESVNKDGSRKKFKRMHKQVIGRDY